MPRIDPPGPRGWPLLGVAAQFRRDPLEFLMHCVAQYGDVVQLPLLRIPLTPMEPKHCCYVVNQPALVKQICVTQRRKYRTHKQLVDKLKVTLELGEGELLTSVGPQWVRRKALLQPSFNEKRIASCSETIDRAVGRLVARWHALADGAEVDIAAETTRFTTHLFAALFLDLDLDGEDAALAQSWERMLDGLSRRMAAPLPVLNRLPTRFNREFGVAFRAVDLRLYQAIAARRDASVASEDFLSQWMQAAKQNGDAALDAKSLRDQLLLMLLAGRRNVANALAWSCQLLGRHPAVASKLAAEATITRNSSEHAYVRQVRKEVLRLYPTAWLIARFCLEDDRVGGYFIPQGATVFMSPYVLHRHPSYWRDPETFDPQRFADDEALAPDSYLPFSRGPRTCIGNFLTESVMDAVMQALSRHFVFLPKPGHRVRIKATSSLHPDGGLPMIVMRRKGGRA